MRPQHCAVPASLLVVANRYSEELTAEMTVKRKPEIIRRPGADPDLRRLSLRTRFRVVVLGCYGLAFKHA